MIQFLRNIFDILLVAYLIYRVILFIKGTRAVQVLWGLIVLLLLTFAAIMLDLHATFWLIKQFWLAGIVLVVIVFQPEIRVALAELGSKPLGRILESHEFDFIKELMDAVRYFKSNSVGFLAVLEQDTGLKDIVKTGVIINGKVSKELLISMFFPKTPLHDGAVIIANNRLIAAGCILPLTEDKDMSKIFGMRHRAAVGITEVSDAIAIVVSEETGKIALVRSGRIQTDVDADDIEKRLYDLYRSKAEKSLLRRSPRAG